MPRRFDEKIVIVMLRDLDKFGEVLYHPEHALEKYLVQYVDDQGREVVQSFTQDEILPWQTIVFKHEEWD